MNKPSKAMFWAGWIMSALPTLMLIMSGVMKFSKSMEVVEGIAKFGYPESSIVGIGVIELISTALYVVPQTSVLGAILLTGYLGGAVATHVRVEDAFLFPVLFGMLVWGGLWLRDPRIRQLIPLCRCTPAKGPTEAGM